MKRCVKVPVVDLHMHSKHVEARVVIGMMSDGHTRCCCPCFTNHLISHGKDSNQHSIFDAAYKSSPHQQDQPSPFLPLWPLPLTLPQPLPTLFLLLLTAAADAVLTLIRMHRVVAVRKRRWRWRRCNLSLAVSMTPRRIPKKSVVMFPNDRNCG